MILSSLQKKLVYDFALQLGREGAVQELLHNYEKSEVQYERGLLLLEQLFAEVTSPKDKEVLENFVNNFSSRINQVRFKKTQ